LATVPVCHVWAIDLPVEKRSFPAWRVFWAPSILISDQVEDAVRKSERQREFILFISESYLNLFWMTSGLVERVYFARIWIWSVSRHG
jgi:hypothetical protein